MPPPFIELAGRSPRLALDWPCVSPPHPANALRHRHDGGGDTLLPMRPEGLHTLTRKTSIRTESSCCREHSTCSFFKRCNGGRSMDMALSRLYVCDPEMCFRWRPDHCIRLSIDWSARTGCSLSGSSQRASKGLDITGSRPRGKSSWPRIWADGSGLSKRLGR